MRWKRAHYILKKSKHEKLFSHPVFYSHVTPFVELVARDQLYDAAPEASVLYSCQTPVS